jgi:hypothetical protein
MSSPATRSTMPVTNLPSVRAEIAYLAAAERSPQVHVYPPSSGLASLRPREARGLVTIYDARPVKEHLHLDHQGFELLRAPTGFTDFYNDAAVREHYYPDVEAVMRRATGAAHVIVFDHNVRSSARAARGEFGVRVPVAQIHNDYTEASGPKRKLEVLGQAGKAELADRRVAFVNLWRPIVGPVQDNCLALCESGSVSFADLVSTDIHHYGEGDLETPRHTGQIFSVRPNPAHRWFYFSDMQPDEALLLKCYDSNKDGTARYTPHTGFANPACPSEFVPRESIEARTLLVFE